MSPEIICCRSHLQEEDRMVRSTWFRRIGSLLSAGALCLTIVASLAHPATAAPEAPAALAVKGAGHGHGGKLMAALERLNLTESQKAQLRAIQERYRGQLQDLRRSGDRERLKAVRMKMRAEMMAVLTPEQRRELKEERAKARAARRAQS
jgi:Spy/CpxP family protein refolding chaperone